MFTLSHGDTLTTPRNNALSMDEANTAQKKEE
jgi:hypothetical protein